MTMIVTRQQAADHLRIDDASPEAEDLDLKIRAASGAVLDYVEREESYYGTPPNFPHQLEHAVLILVGDFHRFRDSGDFQYKLGPAQLPQTVRALLHPLKSFGIADD